METSGEYSHELPNDLKTTLLQALQSGVDPNMLKQAIDDEVKILTVKDEEVRKLKIQEELKTFIDTHKAKLSTTEDFETLRNEERERWGDQEYTEGQINHTFSYWEKAPVGKAFLKSDDPKKLTMFYKGSDEQLYSVEFDLTELLINGEKVNRDQLHAYLDHFSPFITAVKLRDFHGRPSIHMPHDDTYFIEFVEKLYWVCRNRQSKETNKVTKETREALVKKFDI